MEDVKTQINNYFKILKWYYATRGGYLKLTLSFGKYGFMCFFSVCVCVLCVGPEGGATIIHSCWIYQNK